MKKLIVIAFLAVASFAYTGFMQLSKGAWAKYEVHSDSGEKFTMTTKFLGTTKYKDMQVNIVEIETLMPKGFTSVVQYWSAVGNDKMVKRIISKTPNGIMCMSEEMVGKMGDNIAQYHTTTPKEYSPKLPNIKFGTYTLPNGKKIKVAIFKEGKSEAWVSSEVPFGLVLVKENGKVVMRLIDYGLKGAKAIIPLKEAKSCAPVNLPFPAM